MSKKGKRHEECYHPPQSPAKRRGDDPIFHPQPVLSHRALEMYGRMHHAGTHAYMQVSIMYVCVRVFTL